MARTLAEMYLDSLLWILERVHEYGVGFHHCANLLLPVVAECSACCKVTPVPHLDMGTGYCCRMMMMMMMMKIVAPASSSSTSWCIEATQVLQLIYNGLFVVILIEIRK